MTARENKRKKLIEKYAAKREALKKQLLQAESEKEFYGLQKKLQELPKNSSKIRAMRRCAQCGRPHAVYRKFRLCRICLRNHLMDGDVTGGTKSSW